MQSRSKAIITTEKELAEEYLRAVPVSTSKALALFTYDAVLYEPFSNSQGGLRGKEDIGDFLKIAHMANQGLQKEITFQIQGKNKIDAIVQFRRGDSVKGKFQFIMEDVNNGTNFQKKIKELRIQFLTQDKSN